MTTQELIQAVAAGKYDEELRDLQLAVKARRSVLQQQKDAVMVPTHQVADDVSPRYLAGTKGRVGGWTSADRSSRGRRQFFPVPGSQAYARNRVWRVTSGSLQELV